MDSANDLPDDIESLKSMLIAERAAHAAERSRLVEQNDRLLHTLRQLQRNHFGRKSERLSEDQLNLGLEDLETAIASGEAAQEKADATLAPFCQVHDSVPRGRQKTVPTLPNRTDHAILTSWQQLALTDNARNAAERDRGEKWLKATGLDTSP